MRSSQILSVCGSPEIKVERLPAAKGEVPKYQVTLLGLDVFNPVTMEVYHKDSPRPHLPGNRTVEFSGIRVPARTQSLSGEAALINGKNEPVAVVFGPEHGAI